MPTLLRATSALLLALGLAPPALAEPAADAPGSPEVPVLFRHEELFTIRSQVGSLGPAERARATEQRLRELPPSAASDIRVEERSGSSDLYAGPRFVMSVTGLDAAPTGRTRQQLAADYARNLRVALEREEKGRSVRGVLVAILLTILATALLGLVLRLSRRGFLRLYALLRAWQGTRIPTLGLHGMELLSARRATEALISIARTLHLALAVLAVVVYANAVLGFFPWTRGLARAVFDQVWRAAATLLAGAAGFLPNLVTIVLILFVARVALKVARLVSTQVSEGGLHLPGFHREWADPTYKLVRFAVWTLAFVVMFPYLPGSGSPAFRAVGIFLGVVLAIGSAPAVSNVVAGLVLTYMRPFALGDRVKIAETVGDVVERNLLVVRVRTADNVEVTLSNTMVLGAHIVNYSAAGRAGGLVLRAAVTLGEEIPWQEVHALLVSAAEGVEGVLPLPRPFVLQTSLGDEIAYELHAHTDRIHEMELVSSRLRQAVQARLREAGVEPVAPRAERRERPLATPRAVRGAGGDGG